jgi:hypothetical protein
MNRTGIALASALFLFSITFAYAQQQESGQEPDSKQQEPKHPAAVPSQKPSEPDSSREARPQQEEPSKSEKPEMSKPKEQPKTAQEEHGRTAQKGKVNTSGKSAHIPDAKFKANFGRQHSFTVNRVITTTTIVPQQTQFVFSGFTFVFLDPWPAEWLITDDCFIDFVDDEYFLVDVLHPGVRVALFVVG